ncbi:MAG: type II secretion system protein [Gemmatimonadota bacterium]|nr:type II secretion system protein [Gemmatimonadota bacterium]
MRATPDTAGFTLVELLVGMIVVAVLGSSLVTLLRVQHHAYNDQNAGVLAMQNARAGLDMMSKEMRNAGFDPYGLAGAGVTEWTATSFGYTADLNDDGDVLDPDEVVTYLYDPDDDLLVRREGGVQATVATRVTDLEFRYWSDEAGTPASTAAEIEQIRIRMEYETAEGALTGSLTTTVALRNQIYE